MRTRSRAARSRKVTRGCRPSGRFPAASRSSPLGASFLLAVDQQFGEGAGPRVAPRAHRAKRFGRSRVGKGRGELGARRHLGGQLDYQNQVRDHAADESDRPDKLLQQRLISLNGIRRGSRCGCTRGFRRPCPALTALHLCTLLHRCRWRSHDCDRRIRYTSASVFLVGRRYHWLPYVARGGAPEG
jgi:hypothetical protein